MLNRLIRLQSTRPNHKAPSPRGEGWGEGSVRTGKRAANKQFTSPSKGEDQGGGAINQSGFIPPETHAL